LAAINHPNVAHIYGPAASRSCMRHADRSFGVPVAPLRLRPAR
jgi:hypothetical protein